MLTDTPSSVDAQLIHVRSERASLHNKTIMLTQLRSIAAATRCHWVVPVGRVLTSLVLFAACGENDRLAVPQIAPDFVRIELEGPGGAFELNTNGWRGVVETILGPREFDGPLSAAMQANLTEHQRYYATSELFDLTVCATKLRMVGVMGKTPAPSIELRVFGSSNLSRTAWVRPIRYAKNCGLLLATQLLKGRHPCRHPTQLVGLTIRSTFVEAALISGRMVRSTHGRGRELSRPTPLPGSSVRSSASTLVTHSQSKDRIVATTVHSLEAPGVGMSTWSLKGTCIPFVCTRAQKERSTSSCTRVRPWRTEPLASPRHRSRNDKSSR